MNETSVLTYVGENSDSVLTNFEFNNIPKAILDNNRYVCREMQKNIAVRLHHEHFFLWIFYCSVCECISDAIFINRLPFSRNSWNFGQCITYSLWINLIILAIIISFSIHNFLHYLRQIVWLMSPELAQEERLYMKKIRETRMTTSISSEAFEKKNRKLNNQR